MGYEHLLHVDIHSAECDVSSHLCSILIHHKPVDNLAKNGKFLKDVLCRDNVHIGGWERGHKGLLGGLTKAFIN